MVTGHGFGQVARQYGLASVGLNSPYGARVRGSTFGNTLAIGLGGLGNLTSFYVARDFRDSSSFYRVRCSAGRGVGP